MSLKISGNRALFNNKLLYNAALVSVSLLLLFCSITYAQTCYNNFLRPPSYKNGHSRPDFKESLTNPVPENPAGKQIEGAVTKVSAYEGLVSVRKTAATGEAEGPETLVPAGTSYTQDEAVAYPLSQDALKDVPAEFSGTPMDFIGGQLKASQIIALGKSAEFQAFTNNKVIEFNTDILPDFAIGADSPEKSMVTGVLNSVAQRLLHHTRDRRFAGRLFIDFVSRAGGEGAAKRNAIIRIFKGLPIVKKYRLDELLFTEKAKGGDRLTITHKQDYGQFRNPALMLSSESVSEKKVMVYPWATVIDLSVGILSVDRTLPSAQEGNAYAAIKYIYQDLLKNDVSDELLQRFLSNDIDDAINAARELALPPVQRIDFNAIDELNRILRKVAVYA